MLCRFNARHHIPNDAEYVLTLKIAMESLKGVLRENLQRAPLSPEHISQIAKEIQQAAVNIKKLAKSEEKARTHLNFTRNI